MPLRVAHRGGQGGRAQRHRHVAGAQRFLHAGGTPSGRAVSSRGPGAHRQGLAASLLPADESAMASQRCSRGRSFIVHDREASRVPWEVLRIGHRASRTRRGTQSPLRERYADRGTLARTSGRPADCTARAADRRSHPATCQVLPPKAQRCSRLFARRARSRSTLLAGKRRDARSACSPRSAPDGFDVLHFAGHAFFRCAPARAGRAGVRKAREVLRADPTWTNISVLPALVFCNACEAARVRKPAACTSRLQRGFGVRRSMTGIAEGLLCRRRRQFCRHALARGRRGGICFF